MKTDRIREIQEGTAYPDSVSVKQALLQVWNECEQEYANQPQTLQDWKKWEDTVQSFLRSRHLSKDWYDYIKDFKDMPNGAYDQPQTKDVSNEDDIDIIKCKYCGGDDIRGDHVQSWCGDCGKDNYLKPTQ